MIRVVRLSFSEQHIDEFKQFFESRSEAIRNFEGCTYLELWQDNKHPNIFYTYSIWNDTSNLENYRISKLFQDTWTQVKLWFNEKPQAFSGNVLFQSDKPIMK